MTSPGMSRLSLYGRFLLYRSLIRRNPNASRLNVWRFTGGWWL